MTSITISVPGIPKPQGSLAATVVGGKALMFSANKATRPWRQEVAYAMREAWTGEPAAGAVTLTLKFWLPRPASVSEKQRPNHVVKPDLDKLCRAILDAGTGVLYRDDSQVFYMLVSKWYSGGPEHPHPGVEIEFSS